MIWNNESSKSLPVYMGPMYNLPSPWKKIKQAHPGGNSKITVGPVCACNGPVPYTAKGTPYN